MEGVPGPIMDARMHTRTHAHCTHMHVPVCLSPVPVFPQSALKHAPRAKVAWAAGGESSGWGLWRGCTGGTALPVHPDWGLGAPTWVTEGGST